MSRIVVGIDGSKPARHALEWAVDEARIRGATLEVVCAWQYPYLTTLPTAAPVVDREVLEESAVATIRHALEEVDTSGVEVVTNPVPGPPAMALVERGETADLLVVGSRGHGGFRSLLLGSVAQQVVTHATCPVVVARSGAH